MARTATPRLLAAPALAGLLALAACGPDQVLALPTTTTAPAPASADPSPTSTTSTLAGARSGTTTPRPATTTTTTEAPPDPAVPDGRYRQVVFPASAVDVQRGIAYGQALDRRGHEVDLQLDLFTPGGDDPVGHRPVVVLVHGGGFVSGDRTGLDDYARDLVRRGWAAATVEYRLGEGVGSDWRGPAVQAAVDVARDDVQAALRWLRANAGEHGLDGDRLVVLGYSAGAMTAIEVGLHPAPGASVRAVVSVAGTVVHADDVHAPAPPMLLLHGDADRAVAPDLAASTCELATAAGISCTLQTFPGVGHEIVSSRRSVVLDAATTFLADVLGLGVA